MKRISKEEKERRIEQANKAIDIIASYGRNFFSNYDNDRRPRRSLSRFMLDESGHLYFVDDYTCAAIYVMYRRGSWHGFSHGGTLRTLVCEMADWITGRREKFPQEFLGPWPKWVCGDGDLWGYGLHEMATVREKISHIFS